MPRMNVVDWVDPSCRSLLDVGCNVGALLSTLESRLSDVSLFGVDVNGHAIALARERHPQISFSEADICRLPFEADSFDSLTCLEVLEHVEREAAG